MARRKSPKPGERPAEELPGTEFPDDDGYDVPPEPGDGSEADSESVSAPMDDDEGSES